jgi:hypothetical protein
MPVSQLGPPQKQIPVLCRRGWGSPIGTSDEKHVGKKEDVRFLPERGAVPEVMRPGYGRFRRIHSTE